MNKDQFKKYRGLPKERDYLLRKIKILEHKESQVPIVKTKVQSSQKEWPYVETHVTVEAPEPVRSTAIKRELNRTRKRLAKVEHDLDELTRLLNRVEDARDRQILMARFVDGDKLKDVALKFDLTDQWVMRIIEKTIKIL